MWILVKYQYDSKSSVLYYVAAATTAVARILHPTLVPNVIGRYPNSSIFYRFWNSQIYLGNTYAKEMGENIVSQVL
jgi:hypothetical protein